MAPAEFDFSGLLVGGSEMSVFHVVFLLFPLLFFLLSETCLPAALAC